MGNQGSQPTAQQEGPCFCLLGGNLSQQLRRLGNSDPIGTPMPDTPQYQRRMREQVKDAFIEQQGNGNGKGKNGNSSFNSRFGGLEEDPGGSSQLLLPPSGNGRRSKNGTTDQRAGVYEGPDCEQKVNEKYELLEVLGVGSTSTVHRCRNRANQEGYACKIIDCTLIEERFSGMMAQFQTEIEALRQLQHPSIIRLYDVFISKEKIYIVMELMEGGELFDYVVQKGTLTEEEASGIVRKVTSALVYMHEKNIVHRDLKPENLLLKKKPTSNSNADVDVKIIDFGLSKAMEEPVARTFLGTRGYLAPEMLQRRDYTRAVDSWALGVIVFVLLCGCLPFDDDSATVPSDDLVKAKFILRFPRWAKNLSSSAKNLLSHLLDVNPRSRYTAEQALAHPWVRGDTAPSGNMLASPGRIKPSPAAGNQGKNTAARISKENAARRQNELASELSPPAKRIPRKQSF
uniref:Protein kinase domain-containing protein n=1 Tax=Entomoneis paludosa TaxID=265537 RepID=A0A7S2VGY0_9STRA|mmetsp:Transcript_18400/g.38009  ORF Transcript_18400/g.38009 Transcript_18400/m.38009 type:complete len:459 (+) Transcript_18400:293-1669(+)